MVGAVGMSASNLFLYCYYGKLTTNSFVEMSHGLYESNWVELPVNLQKYYILMLANIQIPLYYHGFGVAVLNLETFTKVSTHYSVPYFKHRAATSRI